VTANTEMIQRFICLDAVVQKVYQYCKRLDKILVAFHLRRNFCYNTPACNTFSQEL